MTSSLTTSSFLSGFPGALRLLWEGGCSEAPELLPCHLASCLTVIRITQTGQGLGSGAADTRVPFWPRTSQARACGMRFKGLGPQMQPRILRTGPVRVEFPCVQDTRGNGLTP